jgi:hypothetical protein
MTHANELTNQTTNSPSSKPKLMTLACTLGFIILLFLYAKTIGF